MREALNNAAKWKELEDDDDPEALWKWLMWKALDRSNFSGILGPLLSVYTGLKYERDISSALVGPYLSTFLKNAQSILEVWAGRNSGNTNTAENNAAQAAYQLIVQPALVATLLAAGPTAGVSSLLFRSLPLFALSSNAARKGFADAVGGPKPPVKHAKNDTSQWWSTP